MTTWAEIMRRIAERLAEIILGIIGVPLAVVGWTGGVVAEAWRIARTDPEAQHAQADREHAGADDIGRLAALLEAATPAPAREERRRYAAATDDPEAGRSRRAQRFISDLPAPEDDEEDLDFAGALPVCR